MPQTYPYSEWRRIVYHNKNRPNRLSSHILQTEDYLQIVNIEIRNYVLSARKISTQDGKKSKRDIKIQLYFAVSFLALRLSKFTLKKKYFPGQYLVNIGIIDSLSFVFVNKIKSKHRTMSFHSVIWKCQGLFLVICLFTCLASSYFCSNLS